MELGNTITSIGLRSTVRLAWGIARAARAMGALGERVELAADRQAHRSRVDMAKVLEPLISDARA
ncbi:hypothetical protein BSN85_34255 [Bradyrhizobium brasilense]|nr:hypothetical protein BSN85_34255 [Bradyrhizobium brasilense]